MKSLSLLITTRIIRSSSLSIPPPPRTLDIRKNREFENLKCFKFLDNHIDVLQGNISIYFKISPFEIFEFVNFNFY